MNTYKRRRFTAEMILYAVWLLVTVQARQNAQSNLFCSRHLDPVILFYEQFPNNRTAMKLDDISDILLILSGIFTNLLQCGRGLARISH